MCFVLSSDHSENCCSGVPEFWLQGIDFLLVFEYVTTNKAEVPATTTFYMNVKCVLFPLLTHVCNAIIAKLRHSYTGTGFERTHSYFRNECIR